MSLSLSDFDPILKEHYSGQKMQNLVYKDRPLLALLPKMESFVGRNHPLPLLYGNPQNRSATFSTAVAGTQNSLVEAFTLTRVQNYSLAFIAREALKASEGDAGAFAAALTTEVDGAVNALSADIAFGIGRDSSGYRAQVNAEPSEASTTVITLKSAADVAGFEVGQTIVIHSAKSGGSARIYATGVSSGVISAVSRSLTGSSTITINTAYDSNGTIAANDYIFVSGDRGSKISGLEDWVPDSAPSSTSFFGVDRTADTVRLGGVRHDGSAQNIEEALIDGAFAVGAIGGGTPDYCFVHPKQFAILVKSLGSKVQFVDLDVNGAIGFRGVMLHGPNGPIKVLADRNVRDARAYMLQMDTWKLASLGPLVHLMEDDAKMLRVATADSYEVRVGSYAQLGCQAPGHNGVVTLAT